MKLYEILAKLNTAEDVAIFFDDLCTYSEIDKMEQRVEAAQMFLDGATYNQVIQKTEISSATLSRVSRCIRRGSGGYSRLLKAMMEGERADQPETAEDVAVAVEDAE